MSLISGDRKIARVQSEVTYGVDPIAPGPPTVFQAFRAIDIVPQQIMIESPRATFSASGERHCVINSHNDLTWEMPMSGRLVGAGTPPAWDAWIMASGFRKTVVAATSVAYRPNTVGDMADTPSATCWIYALSLENNQAYLQRASGYRGNLSINMTIGEEAVISGSGIAIYSPRPVSTITKPSAPSSYEGAICALVTNLVVTIGAVSYPVESIEISSGWTVTEIRTGSATAGTLTRALLTRGMSGGRMSGSLKLVDGLTALQACITAMQSGATLALSATLTDGVRTTTITAPALQFGAISSSAEGVVKHDVPFFLTRGTVGDDEIVITLT